MMHDTVAARQPSDVTSASDGSPNSIRHTARAEATVLIGSRVVTGAVWVLVGFGVSRLLGFLTNLFLARLLTPADFGVVSFAMVTIGACTILQDLGVPAAIIHGSRQPRSVGGTALTINVVVAMVLFLATMLMSPLLGAAGNDPRVASIVTALAVGLVFSSVGSVQMALVQRELDFRRKTMRDMIAFLVSGCVAAVAALLGFGAWSLVLGYLARTSTSTLVFWYGSSYRPKPELHFGVARELLAYGSHVSFGSILGFMTANIDYIIVGTVLGSTSLGLYTMAYVMATLPSTVIGEMVGTTTFPAFSRLRDDPGHLYQMIVDVLDVTCLVSVSMGIVLLVCAPIYIPILLGDKWLPVIAPLQILATFGAIRAIVAAFTPVYKAVGRPDLIWKSSLMRLLTLAPALWLTAGYGVEAVAMTHVVAAAPFLAFHMVLLSRAIDAPVRELLKSATPQGIAISTIVVVMALGLRTGDLDALHHDPVRSIALAAVAVAVYGAVAVALNPRLLDLARAGLRLVMSSR